MIGLPARIRRAVAALGGRSGLVAVGFAAALVVPAVLSYARARDAELRGRADCLAALTALVPGEGRIAVLALSTSNGARERVRVVWRPADAPAAPPRELACLFALDGRTPERTGLVGLRTEAGDLSEARLFALDRFWLAVPEARATGRARLEFAPGLTVPGI